MDEVKSGYSSYDYDLLETADRMKIDRKIYFEESSADISPLTAFTLEQLLIMQKESRAAEQMIFENLQGQAAAWEKQAGNTLLLNKAIEHMRTPHVQHTANKWREVEHHRHIRSNRVYQMSYYIYESTRYDRETQQSIPYSWTLTWSVRTNSPSRTQAKIAGQNRKVFTDKAAMEKYLNGRIKAYNRLFTEISPPIPQEYAEYFKVNGMLMPDYIIEGKELPQQVPAITENTEQQKERETISTQFSIMIGNRSRFEVGDGGGYWLDLPATKEQLQVAMQSVGITADNPQDFSIRGYSDNPDKHIALPYEMVCAASVDELNFLAARLNQLNPAELDKLNAAVQRQNGFENIGQIIDFTYNVDYFVHIPEVHTPRDLGDYYLNKSGMVDMPEEWKGGIDLAAFGKNAAEQEKGAFTEYGYIVESGDEWERHFEGRDVPEEYRIMSYPQLEQTADFDAIAPAQAVQPNELRPITPIILSAETTDDKMKEITDRLEQGIAGIFESERYAEYLRTISKFHEYSFNNTLLIAMQGGNMVKGYRQWEKEFDRHVKPGEKAIKIIAPAPYKVKKQAIMLDPETKQPVLDKDGQPVTEEKEITIPNYKVVSVFDVSQTEGKELPELGVFELLGDVKNYEDFFAALKRTSPFEISLEPLEAEVNGRCLYDERRIQIDDKMSELQTIKTVVHEIAHATLHDIDRDAPERPDRSTREVQAESVAYTVCQYYGLDTSDYSFGYIAEWHSGRELAELKSSLETVRSTAATLIETIDGHFAEIQKERETQKETRKNLDPAIQPVVTVVWSESNELQDGIKLPLSRANEIFRSLDAAKLNERGYDKTKFEIDYTLNGEASHYEGQQDFGDGDGSLIEHIEKFHTGYAQDEEYKSRLLHNDGQEAMEQTIAGHEQVVNEFVPYLKLHDSLSQMEQAAGQAMREADNLTPTQTAYYEALQQYVDDCRAMLNQGNYTLPAAPRLSDFDPELQEYKQHVMDEITQEAADAGMTVEEYATNGYEPRTPVPETPVFDKLPPEQQQALSDTVKDTLQMLIDADMAAHGEVTDSTLEAVATQGYSYRDGRLEKQTETAPPEQPEKTPDEPQPTGEQTTTHYYTINESAARRAKMMNSFDDYRPGSATAEYRRYIDEAVQLAERQKSRVDPMYHDKIDSLLDTYARKLAANMNASYSIEARVPSIMISGGGNFPVRQKEKQNAARDRNMQEWQYIQGLLDKIRSTGMGGISADDPQAIQKLEKKLESLTKAQENMKAINAYYRKHKSLDGCPLVSPERAQRLISEMASYDRVPYPAWALSNNSAEIRRLKNRIVDLSQKQEIGFIGWEFEGGKVEANTADNRLQILFDEKPDAATREALKSGGFRWSPRAEAWQRQLNDNAYYASNHIKAIQPLTGEKPTELLRAHIRQQKAALQQKPAPDMDMSPDKDTFSIYQLKGGDETRDLRFEPYDRLQAAGHTVDPANYDLVYTAPLAPDTSLEDIFTRFNIDHPADFTGHSLSMSDIIVLRQGDRETAHYLDRGGYRQVPEFLQERQKTLEPDEHTTGETIRTPRGTFSLTDMTPEQMKAAGYGVHHTSEDGRYLIMTDNTRAFAVAAQPEKENPLKYVEDTIEQNDNSFDGLINNTPTVDELEQKAKAGEQISLYDLANAIKDDEKRGKAAQPEKKPSILAQLKADKEKAAPKKAVKSKNHDLEV